MQHPSPALPSPLHGGPPDGADRDAGGSPRGRLDGASFDRVDDLVDRRAAPDPSASAAPRPTPSRLRRVTHVALVAAILGVAVFGSIPLCPFAIVTRQPCPGCGLTRATLAMLHGDFAQALHFHPVSLVMAPIAIVGMAYNAIVYVVDGRKAAAESLQGKWVTRFAIVLAVAMVGVWIARFFGAFGGPVPV